MSIKTDKNDSLEFPANANYAKSLEKPKTASAGAGRAVFWALIALLLLGVAAWWLFATEASKQELREEADNNMWEVGMCKSIVRLSRRRTECG